MASGTVVLVETSQQTSSDQQTSGAEQAAVEQQTTSDQQAAVDQAAAEELTDDALGRIDAWVDWGEASDLLGVSVSKVRQLIREHFLAAVVPATGSGQLIPAELIMDGEVVKGVPGVLTVLHDAGFADREAIGWLFTPDDSIPGRPIDALRENRGSEIKRRAQALGF